MKSFVAMFALCFAIQAQAQSTFTDATLTAPGASPTSEDVHLLQSSPAMEASQIVAPLTESTATTSFETIPAVIGSQMFRAPTENTTIVDLSATGASSTNREEVYVADMNPYDFVIAETDSEATLYSFRLTHGLTDSSAIFFDAGFLKSDVEMMGAGTTQRRGMRDLEIGYQGRVVGERSAWIFGGSLAGSPESSSKYSSAGTGFSGGATGRGFGAYERRLARATGGVALGLRYDMGTRNDAYYDGGFRSIGDIVGDVKAYYEFPIAKSVDFGVAGGLASDGAFPYSMLAYHATAYSAISIMKDMQFRLEAQGATVAYNSTDSATSTKITGMLSKAL